MRPVNLLSAGRVPGAIVALLVYAASAPAQPPTDIYLGQLRTASGSPSIEGLVDITHRAGYDNQPFFTPGGDAILYTSIRDDGQADTYRYVIGSGRVERVTRTPESEYSPTPMPDAARFSTVRVEMDSAQRLWAFELDGGNPELLLPDIEPVGYHAWGDAATVALYVLGEPATLHIADLDGRDEVVANRIGRSLHKVPGRRAISFLEWESDEEGWIKLIDLATGRIETLTRARRGNEHYAWTPDGSILMGQGTEVYRWRPDSDWSRIAELADTGLHEISRIAVSGDGRRIAIVDRRPAP